MFDNPLRTTLSNLSNSITIGLINLKKLEEKIALVTDGTSSIRLATAQLFVEKERMSTGRRQTELDTAVTKMGRVGTPDEIAKAVVFLASDDSSFVNGIDELFVDGGMAHI